MKILAVDDNRDNLISLGALLKTYLPGSVFVSALSGQEGLEKARTESPDTILLDIHMPGMDGFQVCRMLKNDDQLKHIPIIMLTAIKTDQASRIHGLECGAEAFLSKPIDPAELTSQVKAMIRIKLAEDQLRRKAKRLEMSLDVRTMELHESEGRFRSLVQSHPDAIMVSTDDHITYVNPAAVKLYRASRKEDLMGQAVLDLVPQEEKAAFTAQIHRSMTGNCPVEPFDTYMIKLTGTPVPVSITGVHIIFSGKPALMFVVRDVTSMKQAEEDRKKLEEQIRQIQKMEAIGTLAGGIAHDFNNILAAIIGYTELTMMDVPEDWPARQHMEQVLKAGMRAKNLVQQILSFSRRTVPERKPLEIDVIIKEALKFLRASLPSTIEIRTDIEKSPGTVLADPTQIHQVLTNLCSNAAYAMRETGGLLEVRLSQLSVDDTAAAQLNGLSPGDYQRLTVRDTGQGMDPEIVERIFEPFFTTKGPGEGTGMGLSVVYGIVKDHYGAITVDSQLGKGTIFQVYLPLTTKPAERDPLAPATSLPTGHERILFVDDEATLVNLGHRMLARLGYRVTSKSSSLEALEAFRAEPGRFDLVITDQTMPHLTGLELAHKLWDIKPELPIILCTGFSQQITAEMALEMGIKRFLTKPLVVREVAETVRSVLDGTGKSRGT